MADDGGLWRTGYNSVMEKPEPYKLPSIPAWAWEQIKREDAEAPVVFKPDSVASGKVDRVFTELVRELYPRVT